MAEPLNRTDLKIEIPEGTSRILTIPIKNHLGLAIDSGDVDTLKLTLYENRTKDPINGRDHQSILNVNQGVLGAGGILTFELLPADTAILHAATGINERHVGLLEWTFASGARAGAAEFTYMILNMAHRPAP